jgi:hypothetical protein
MEFRHLGNGQTFPPIAPNGRIYAVPVTQENQVEIFCLTSDGIVGCSVTAFWADITGAYYDDESWEIILHNYISRAMTQAAGGEAEVTKTAAGRRSVTRLRKELEALKMQKEHTFLADGEVFQNPARWSVGPATNRSGRRCGTRR